MTDLLIKNIMKDTVEIDLDLLRTWLANKESLEAEYGIVGTYLSEGDFSNAWQALGNIPQFYTLDNDELDELEYFEEMIALWQDADTNGVSLAELDSLALSLVQEIAENSTRLAGAMAQGILNSWYGGYYRVVPKSSGGSQSLMAPPNGNSYEPAPQYIIAYPNPAGNSVTFQWHLPDDSNKATIILSDLQGRVVDTITIEESSGKLEWPTSKVERGIYLYQLRLADGSLNTSKLTIIK
jgi:hypothetical protein